MSLHGGSGSPKLTGTASATAAGRNSFVNIDCRLVARRDIDVGILPGATRLVRRLRAQDMPPCPVPFWTLEGRGCPSEIRQRRGTRLPSAASSCGTSGVARHG